MPEGGHPDRFQTFIDTLPDLLRRQADILRAKADILLHDGRDDLIVRVLENHAGRLTDRQQILFRCRLLPVDPHRPFRRCQKRIEMLRQRGFPGAIVPQNSHKLARRNRQIHMIHCPKGLIRLIVRIGLDVIVYHLIGPDHR